MLATHVRLATAKYMTEKDKIIIAVTTCPSDEVARRIAEALVGERLAACVNRISGVQSTYIWKGEALTDSEVLLIIKTTEARFSALQVRLMDLHPYELPELVAIPVCAGAEKYLAWVADTVKSS